MAQRAEGRGEKINIRFDIDTAQDWARALKALAARDGTDYLLTQDPGNNKFNAARLAIAREKYVFRKPDSNPSNGTIKHQVEVDIKQVISMFQLNANLPMEVQSSVDWDKDPFKIFQKLKGWWWSEDDQGRQDQRHYLKQAVFEALRKPPVDTDNYLQNAYHAWKRLEDMFPGAMPQKDFMYDVLCVFEQQFPAVVYKLKEKYAVAPDNFEWHTLRVELSHAAARKKQHVDDNNDNNDSRLEEKEENVEKAAMLTETAQGLEEKIEKAVGKAMESVMITMGRGGRGRGGFRGRGGRGGRGGGGGFRRGGGGGFGNEGWGRGGNRDGGFGRQQRTTCHACNEEGHFVRECPTLQQFKQQQQRRFKQQRQQEDDDN